MSQEIKPGWQTSEAWITGAAQALGAAMALFGAIGPVHPYVQVASVICGALLSIVTQIQYVTKRTELKKALPPFLVSEEYAREHPTLRPGERGWFDLRLALAVLIAIVLGFFALSSKAQAQTVTLNSSQNAQAGVGGYQFGAKLTGVLCTAAAASRWSGWMNVSTSRNIVFDVDFVDANASAASLDVRCETSQVNTTVADAGRDLPVLTATSATGVNTIMQTTWSWVATTGLAPGTSSYVLYIENIPAPWIECLFTCGAGGAAADTITAFARGVNP